MEMLIYLGVRLPSSIRVIAIVKNPMSGEDAYTIEFECMADKSEDLMKELIKTPLGSRAIELINQAKFMPEVNVKTAEELKEEADEEERIMMKHNDDVRTHAINDRDYEWKKYLREVLGDDKAEGIISKADRKLGKKQEDEQEDEQQ